MALEASEVAVRVRLLGGTAFQREADKTAASVAGIEDAANGGVVGGKGRKTANKADNLHSKLTKVGNAVSSFGAKALQVGRSMTFLGAGIGYVGYQAVKSFSTYQRELRLLETQAGASHKQLLELEKGLHGMGGRLGFKPAELAEALYPIQTVLKNTSADLNTLEASAKGARIGLDKLPAVANAAAGLLKIKMSDIHSAAEAVAVMDVATGEGKMHLPELVEGLSSGVLTQANQLKLGARDMLAALAAETAEHIPVALASTRMRYTMTKLSAESSPQAVRAMHKIGLEQFTLTKQLESGPGGLILALKTLQEHLKTVSKDEGRVVLAQMFGQSRGLTNILSLLHSLPQDEKNFVRLQKASSSTLNLHYTQATKTANFKEEQIRAKLDEAYLRIGEKLTPILIPLLLQLAGAVEKLAEGFSKLPKPVQSLVLYIGALGIVLGPILLIFGSLASVAGGAIKSVAWLIKVFGGVSGAADEAAGAKGIGLLVSKLGMGSGGLGGAIGLAVKALGPLSLALLALSVLKEPKWLEGAQHEGGSMLSKMWNDVLHSGSTLAKMITNPLAGGPAYGDVPFASGGITWHNKPAKMPTAYEESVKYFHDAHEDLLENNLEMAIRDQLDGYRERHAQGNVAIGLGHGDVIHIPVNIDGKKVAEVISRVEREKQARR